MTSILIVEDDKTISSSLQYYLETEQFEVDVVDNAKDTYEKLAQKKYSVILLDVTLKRDNGFAMYQTIEQMSEAGIIFLTALDEEDHIVKGLEMGAEDYITKPFHARELLSRIHKVVKRKEQTTQQEKISIKDVTINKTLGNVYKQGKEIPFTGLEYKLLLLLFENKGRIITREKILEMIWDKDENYVNDNTLTVYIKRIRQKMEEDPDHPLIIKTVRGVGYKIGD